MADTATANGSKSATRGDSWVAKHKTPLIVGGIAVVLLLVFLYIHSQGSSSSTITSTGSTAGLNSTLGGLSSSGDLNSLVGPAGPTGAKGKRGKRGKRGPRGKKPVTHHKKSSGTVPTHELTHAHINGNNTRHYNHKTT
jgi:hypothetical protein